MKIFSRKKFIESKTKNELQSPEIRYSLNTWVKECDGKTEEEIEKLGYIMRDIWFEEIETSLYDKELQEKKIIKELKYILHDGQCKPNWRRTIKDTIKLLEGE